MIALANDINSCWLNLQLALNIECFLTLWNCIAAVLCVHYASGNLWLVNGRATEVESMSFWMWTHIFKFLGVTVPFSLLRSLYGELHQGEPAGISEGVQKPLHQPHPERPVCRLHVHWCPSHEETRTHPLRDAGGMRPSKTKHPASTFRASLWWTDL